jgi:hypothetical protein
MRLRVYRVALHHRRGPAAFQIVKRRLIGGRGRSAALRFACRRKEAKRRTGGGEESKRGGMECPNL